MALPNGTVYKPTQPILQLSNGQIDSNKHPFIIVAQDEEAIYGFHMTSHRRNNNPIDEILYQELIAGEHIQYNNPKITQNAYAKIDHIHKIKLEDIYAFCSHYAFITPKTKEILDAMVIKQVFATDYEFSVKDENTDKLAELTFGRTSACRCTTLYDAQRRLFNVREYKEMFDEHINKVRENQQILKQTRLVKSQLELVENNYNSEYEHQEIPHRRAA